MSEIKLTFPEAYELMEAAEKHKRSLGRLYDKASPFSQAHLARAL